MGAELKSSTAIQFLCSCEQGNLGSLHCYYGNTIKAGIPSWPYLRIKIPPPPPPPPPPDEAKVLTKSWLGPTSLFRWGYLSFVWPSGAKWEPHVSPHHNTMRDIVLNFFHLWTTHIPKAADILVPSWAMMHAMPQLCII